MRWRALIPLTTAGAVLIAGCTASESSEAPTDSVTETGAPQSEGRQSSTAAPDPESTTSQPTSTTDAEASQADETAPPATLAPDVLLAAYEPRSGCAEAEVVPFGQSPQAFNFEPLGSIWCFDLNEPPAGTVEEGENSWVDDFDVGCPIESPAGCTSMLSLHDGEMGYRMFDRTGNAPPEQGQHWINQNHWMTDVQGGFTGGSSMRPDRSFRFEDGVMVVEGDFAASIPEYGDTTWGEITISTADEPACVVPPQAEAACEPNDQNIADILYAYGQFGGEWAVGCRLNPSRRPVCAVMGPSPEYTLSLGSVECARNDRDGRVLEVSWFQTCGTTNIGGAETDPNGDNWRTCEAGGPDMACRDRFRMEVRKDGLKLYVNGALYFEDSGWPAAYQIPDEVIADEWYAYQSNWQTRAGDRAFRYHWDRFAVNPSTGPTASETFE